jgi:hypothetical protein
MKHKGLRFASLHDKSTPPYFNIYNGANKKTRQEIFQLWQNKQQNKTKHS